MVSFSVSGIFIGMSIIIKKDALILKEDFNSQKELERLVIDVQKAYIKQYLKLYKLNGEPRVRFFRVFKHINGAPYNILRDFIINFDLKFFYDGELETNGYFQQSDYGEGGIINIRFNDELFKEPIQKYGGDSQDESELIRDIYYDSFSRDVSSTILHELQHAYDYYRSGGKFNDDKKSRKYYKGHNNSNNTRNASSPEQLELNRNTYARLKHEVESRFAQAIYEVNVRKFGSDKIEVKTIKEFVDEVISNFKWMDRMTPKIQKYLYRKASNYYYNKIEELKK